MDPKGEMQILYEIKQLERGLLVDSKYGQVSFDTEKLALKWVRDNPWETYVILKTARFLDL